MLSTLIVVFALAATDTPPGGTASAHEFVLLADDWARPRTGERVASMPALRAAVSAWLDATDATLLVVHPGGERGSLWGAEVRDWLIALGMAPDQVLLRAGAARDDAVVLRLAPAQ